MPASRPRKHPPLTLLGGLTAPAFLRDHWQRRPLLVRNALPGFTGLLDAAALRRLASRDDVQTRLVVRSGRDWSLEHGPFPARRWKKLTPATPWTILLQELNFHLPEADALLRHFPFLPHARIDDVMVSLACAGGGVGPHVDSYDVFLLQGAGRRRWRISGQQDRALRPGLPLKILKSFQAEEDWVLEPGDLLYLPPHYAHEGTAVDDDCQTYSIGFRAPSPQEWVAEFLMDQAEHLDLPGEYGDAGLPCTAHPGALPPAMQRFLQAQLRRLRFPADALADFNGRFLTEPKPHVFFTAPVPALGAAAFRTAALRDGIALDARTRLLFADGRAWCNGEGYALATDEQAAVADLADLRALDGGRLRAGEAAWPARWKKTLWPMLHQWYEDGWLHCPPLLRRNEVL